MKTLGVILAATALLLTACKVEDGLGPTERYIAIVYTCGFVSGEEHVLNKVGGGYLDVPEECELYRRIAIKHGFHQVVSPKERQP